MFLGRAIHYPIAMDGALKLKEVSYIHAEGYPPEKPSMAECADRFSPAAGDDRDLRSQRRGVRDPVRKNVSNMEGFKKQAQPDALATEGDTIIPQFADHTIFIPDAPELLSPILEIVPLQLFAYYVALKRGLDVDRPRNLVKAVTLE